MEDLTYRDFAIAAGKFVGASPSISNRIPEDFTDPDTFDPGRYLEGRNEDRANPGHGFPSGPVDTVARASLRHDAAEGYLFRAPPGLEIRSGATARHVSKRSFENGRPTRTTVSALIADRLSASRMRIVVDRELCQGHGTCEGEAPDVFSVSKRASSRCSTPGPSEDQRPCESSWPSDNCPTQRCQFRRMDDMPRSRELNWKNGLNVGW